jgi:hypothetical protein
MYPHCERGGRKLTVEVSFGEPQNLRISEQYQTFSSCPMVNECECNSLSTEEMQVAVVVVVWWGMLMRNLQTRQADILASLSLCRNNNNYTATLHSCSIVYTSWV